ncbi:MAG: hypothetical protein AB7T59_19335 [Hyphomonadaceae bacterium]
MRFLIAAVALAALAACGDRTPATDTPPVAAAPTVPDEWRGRLTDNPTVARQYGAVDFQVTDPAASVSASGDAVEVTTSPNSGAFSVYVLLGTEAEVDRPRALRLTAEVQTGAMQFVSIYSGFPAGYTPATMDIAAGAPTTIYLPVDENGPPMLVIANASRNGPSRGRITNVELVTAP